MNWNNESHTIDPHPIFDDAVGLEQCNWPANHLAGETKPSISFYNVFTNELDFATDYTVAIWRKKSQPA